MQERIETKRAPEAAGEITARGLAVSGYASVFGRVDGGGDVVMPGAYANGLARIAARGGRVRMLWQHDATQPIGVWDEVREDARGLWVKGRLLPEVARGREAAALLAEGAIDGLSIGYRAVRAERDGQGRRRLHEIDLWEVSLVTFPMQGEARIGAKAAPGLRLLARALAAARHRLAGA